MSANESNAVFAALPWANLNPIPNNGISEYIKNTGKARANSRSRFGWGFTRRIFAPASGDSSGGSGAIIAHGSIDFCSFGAPAPNGWDWQWWERFNTIKSWRESQRCVSSKILGMSASVAALAAAVYCCSHLIGLISAFFGFFIYVILLAISVMNSCRRTETFERNNNFSLQKACDATFQKWCTDDVIRSP